jgi:hypothetical protein
VNSWLFGPAAVASAPTGPAYDIVLLLHIAAVILGTATVVVSGVQAARLRALAPGAALPGSLVAYYRPQMNWAGRVVYLIPVLGLALLGMSQGAYDLDDGWVLAGIVIFVAVIFLAEGLLWPAEQRVARALSAAPPIGGAEDAPPQRRSDALVVIVSSTLVVALIVLASVLMVAKP